MKPFIIEQHENDRNSIRELRETELSHVSGGAVKENKLNTTTVTPSGTKDDGADEG